MTAKIGSENLLIDLTLPMAKTRGFLLISPSLETWGSVQTQNIGSSYTVTNVSHHKS